MAWWDNLDGPILGRYRIERLLGEGGMARVFLATDIRADRPVALKTPKIESFPPESVPELLSRFSREFRSQASDPIQGVIPIYESGEFTDAGGVVRPFLAMQYLSGGSLGDLLGGTIGKRERTQTLSEVLDWLVSISRTLDRLHSRRFLHRDVKPDNILFNSDDDPFLADLGIVGSLDPSLNGSMLGSTSMGVLASPGSPGYQSPESIQADPALRNISASDQFSLGVTVYEALAGRLPANASTNQEWYGTLLHWAPTPLATLCPELPAAAAAAVMKAMQARPFERFASCSEFARALALAANTQAVPAPQGPPPTSGPLEASTARAASVKPADTKPAPGRSSKVAIGAAVAVGLLLIGLVAWNRGEVKQEVSKVDPPGRDSEPSVPSSGLAASHTATASTISVPGNATVATGPADSPAGTAAATEAETCRPGDDDRDKVDNCMDVCPDSKRNAQVSPLNGCELVAGHLGRSLLFESGQTRVAKGELDEAINTTVGSLAGSKNFTLVVRAYADASEGSAADVRRIRSGREAFVVAELNRRRIPAVTRATKIAPRANSFTVDGKPVKTTIEWNRRVALALEVLPDSAPKPIVPLELSQVPQMMATQPATVPGAWIVCRAVAFGQNQTTMLYTLSEAMNVGAVPDWQDRFLNQKPYTAVLKAAGMHPTSVPTFTCAQIKPTADEARSAGDVQTADWLKMVSSQGWVVSKVPGSWRVKGT